MKGAIAAGSIPTAEAGAEILAQGMGCSWAASSLGMWHRLYFSPLPQGQGAFLATVISSSEAREGWRGWVSPGSA